MSLTLRSSLVLSALSLVVSAISFSNQLIIAHMFGAGRALDLYLVAVSLPLLVTGVFGGLFAFGMVPELVRAQHSTDSAGIGRAFLISFLAIGVAISILGIVTAPAILRQLGELSDSDDIAHASSIARYAWTAAGASVVLGFLSAVLNTRGVFVAPVIASALPYMAMIAVTLTMGRDFGPTTLAWGLLAGTALAVLGLGVLAAPAVAARPSPAHWRMVRAFLASAPSILMASLVFSAFQLADAYWAPRLGEANLSYLGYCQRVVIAVGTILATGPAAVLQPRLSAAVVQGRDDDYRRDLSLSLRILLSVCAPVILFASLVPASLVRIVFERGAFGARDTAAVAGLLPWMLLGSVAMIGVVLLFKALFAKHDLRGALAVGLAGPIIYFVAAGTLSRTFGLQGFGVAYVVSWLTAFAVALRRAWGGPGAFGAVFGNRRFLRSLVFGSAAAAVVTWLGRTALLADGLASSWGVAMRLTLVALAAGLSFLAVTAYLDPIAEVRMMLTAVLGREEEA